MVRMALDAGSESGMTTLITREAERVLPFELP